MKSVYSITFFFMLTRVLSVAANIRGRSRSRSLNTDKGQVHGGLQALMAGSAALNALIPGFYSTEGTAATLAGNLYLLSLADATATNPDVWTFTIDGAFTTADASLMKFVDASGNEISSPPFTTVLWQVGGAIAIGAGSETIGVLTASHGAITTGANAITGDLIAIRGAIDLGAWSTSGDLLSGAAISLGAGAGAGDIHADNIGSIVLGAGATSTGQLTATGGAVNLGAGARVNGQIKSSAAVTLGASAVSCGICAGTAVTDAAGTIVTGVTGGPDCPAANAIVGADVCATELAACTDTKGLFMCGFNEKTGFAVVPLLFLYN